MSMLIRIQYRIRLQGFVIVNFTSERNVIIKSKIAIYLSLGLQVERQKSLRIQIHNTAHNNAKKQGNQRTLSEFFEMPLMTLSRVDDTDWSRILLL
jgi:hypothetical protein